MKSITLHFNVFGQASPGETEGKRTVCVDDPLGRTFGSLKEELFSFAFEEQKSVRFIAKGHILKDADLIGQCGLGSEAHIHVSISESRGDKTPSPQKPASPTTGSTSPAATAGAGGSGGGPAARGFGRGPSRASAPCEHEDSSGLGAWHLLGAVAIAGAAVLFRYSYQRRWQLSMHASQMLCIFAACWVYFVLFHGIPTTLRFVSYGLRSMSRSGGASASEAPQARAPPLSGAPLPPPAGGDLSAASASYTSSAASLGSSIPAAAAAGPAVAAPSGPSCTGCCC